MHLFATFIFFVMWLAPSLSTSDALFAISFDLFGAMILTGEFIAIYRRFVAKTVTFKTSIGRYRCSEPVGRMVHPSFLL